MLIDIPLGETNYKKCRREIAQFPSSLCHYIHDHRSLYLLSGEFPTTLKHNFKHKNQNYASCDIQNSSQQKNFQEQLPNTYTRDCLAIVKGLNLKARLKCYSRLQLVFEIFEIKLPFLSPFFLNKFTEPGL